MTTSTKELIEKLFSLESILPAKGSKTCGESAQRLRELDKTDCVWIKLPCGRDVNGNELSSYDPSCITVYTDEPLPMKLTKFCQYCGGAVRKIKQKPPTA